MGAWGGRGPSCVLRAARLTRRGSENLNESGDERKRRMGGLVHFEGGERHAA
jgi:hypothetical protein